MFDFITWEWLLHQLIYIGFTVIFVRTILVGDFVKWLEDRGLIKRGEQGVMYHLLDFLYFNLFKRKSNISQTELDEGAIVGIMKSLDKWTSAARKVAILQHYGHGHECTSVLECNQGKCSSLFTA